MNTPLSRVFEAAGCQTQVALANLLGIRQSSISDAKRRNRIPAKWLVTLLLLRGANPEWILHGTGPKHIARETLAEGAAKANGAAHGTKAPASDRILDCVSTQDLINELLRRVADDTDTRPQKLNTNLFS